MLMKACDVFIYLLYKLKIHKWNIFCLCTSFLFTNLLNNRQKEYPYINSAMLSYVRCTIYRILYSFFPNHTHTGFALSIFSPKKKRNSLTTGKLIVQTHRQTIKFLCVQCLYM